MRVVTKHYLHGQSHKRIAADLAPLSRSGVKRILRRWRTECTVATWQGRRHGPPANTVMTVEACKKLLELVTLLDDESMCSEIHEEFTTQHGVTCDVSTVCRAMARLGFTRKKLHRLALECDRARADRFYSGVMLNHQPHQLIFLDETSKDMRSINRSYGYALRGMKPRSDLGYFTRGQRISTMASFDMNGFIDWYSITGTFKGNDFLDAVELAVLPYLQAYPGPRSVIILDNASIHKKQAFIDAVAAKGAFVLWLPPYCWHLNPIEEGFGAVRQWLMRNKPLVSVLPGGTQGMLDAAFSSVTLEQARSCFHHSDYL